MKSFRVEFVAETDDDVTEEDVQNELDDQLDRWTDEDGILLRAVQREVEEMA